MNSLSRNYSMLSIPTQLRIVQITFCNLYGNILWEAGVVHVAVLSRMLLSSFRPVNLVQAPINVL